MSVYPECIRCGMCCLIEPCYFGKLGKNLTCVDLLVNGDNTCTCLNKKAIIEFSGSGCIYMCSKTEDLYKEHMKYYKVNERKQLLKENNNDD